MILNLLTNPVACCNKANRCQLCSSHQKKGSIKCETGKWEAVVTNDSIGTCSSVLYIDYASCGTTGIRSNKNPSHLIGWGPTLVASGPFAKKRKAWWLFERAKGAGVSIAYLKSTSVESLLVVELSYYILPV